MLVRHGGRLVLERGGWLVDPERRLVAGHRLAVQELLADEKLLCSLTRAVAAARAVLARFLDRDTMDRISRLVVPAHRTGTGLRPIITLCRACRSWTHIGRRRCPGCCMSLCTACQCFCANAAHLSVASP